MYWGLKTTAVKICVQSKQVTVHPICWVYPEINIFKNLRQLWKMKWIFAWPPQTNNIQFIVPCVSSRFQKFIRLNFSYCKVRSSVARSVQSRFLKLFVQVRIATASSSYFFCQICIFVIFLIRPSSSIFTRGVYREVPEIFIWSFSNLHITCKIGRTDHEFI